VRRHMHPLLQMGIGVLVIEVTRIVGSTSAPAVATWLRDRIQPSDQK
jgi:hypothetical protein